MRRFGLAAIGALSVALVFAMVPAAFAGHHRGWNHGTPAPYDVSKPSVVTGKVLMGVEFDATGTLVPAIAASDASTTVAIEIYGPGDVRHRAPILTVPAALSASADTGTAYAAALAIADPGHYSLVAAVSLDGVVVARSKPREILVVMPFKVTKPRFDGRWVLTGTSFDATGAVTPAIAADDTSTSVSVQVYQLGRHHRPTLVDTVSAVLTGPVGDGSGYAASITLPSAGKYVLVAVVTRDGVVLGKSCGREVRAVDAAPVVPSPICSMRHGR